MAGADESEGPASQGLRGRVASAFGATSALIVVDRFIQILFTAILARIITPAEFGVAAAATAFVSFLILFSQMGIGGVLVQARNLEDRTVRIGATTVLISGAAFTVLGMVAAPLAGAWFRNPAVTEVVRLLALGCVLGALALPSNVLMLRRLEARTLTLVDLITGALTVGLVAIPLAMAGMGYWALALATVAQTVIRTVVLRRIGRAPPGLAFAWAEVRALLARASGYLLTNFMQRLTLEGDRLVVGRYLTAVDLGLYSRASGLMTYPSRFYGAVLDRVAFPAFARVQGDARRMQSAYAEALSLTALVGWPLTVFLVLTGSELILFVLGDAWAGAVTPFKILCLGMYFRLADRVNGALLRGTGRPYLMSMAQFLFVALALAGSLIGLPYGMAGVAAAVVMAAALSDLLLTILAVRTAGLRLQDVVRAQAHGLAGALLLGMVLIPTLWVASALELNAFATLAAAGIVAGIAAFAAAALAPAVFLGAAGRNLVSEIGRAIRARTHR